LHRLLQAPEVTDQAKARLLRQLGTIDPLPAAGYRDPAGTAPQEDQPGHLPRSRDTPDNFVMILGDAMTHTFTMILK